MKLKYYHKLIFASFLSFGCIGLSQAQTPQNDTLTRVINKRAVKQIGFDVQDSLYVTSAISSIKGSELLKNFNTNLTNKLYGRIAGLSVIQGGNESAFDKAGLYARGINSYQNQSISSAEPLVIVDGFLATFDQLVPEEIEEISLLKDASATAVYGMRAANGVLLVTTKRGNEGPLSIGFSSQLGFSRASTLPKPLNSFQYATLYNEARSNDGLPVMYTDTDLEGYQTGNNPTLYPNVNWYNELFRQSAPLSNYNLNFKGGDQTIRYYVTLNAVNSQGLYKNFGKDDKESINSKFSRYNFRSNVDVNINSRLVATLLLGGSIEDKFSPLTLATNAFRTVSTFAPNIFPARLENGAFPATNSLSNPLADISKTGFLQYNGRTVQSALKLNHELDFITKGLSAAAAVSFNSYFQGASVKTKQVQKYIFNATTQQYEAFIDPNLNVNLVGGESYRGQTRSYAFQGFLNYKRTFNEHDIAAMVMFNSDNAQTPPESGININNFLPNKTNGGASRITYVNSKKYIAEFSLGYMGTDNFPKDKRYGFFPAGSIGWIASNESFLKDSKAISFLKFRGSYGLVGNDQIGSRFAFQQVYPLINTSQYFFGGTTTSGFALLSEGRIANMDISWEKERKANIGIDATLFKQLSLTLDLFKNERYDILQQLNSSGDPTSATVPTYLGFNDVPVLNMGKVESKGFEAALGFNSKSGKAITFFAQANVSYFKNKIIENGEGFKINPGTYNAGRSIGTRYGLVAAGLYTSQDEINESPKPAGATNANLRVGDIKYQDIGGPLGVPDGAIDANDNQPLSRGSMPNLVVGLHSGLQFKGFDLDLVFQGVSGRTVNLMDGGNYFKPFQDINAGASSIALERWTPETASTAKFPRLSLNGNQNNYLYSSFYERDGDFIKLRSAELGYSLPKSIVSKIKMGTGRIFVNGTNLLSIDKIKYGDPEALSMGYPPLRSFSLGARITF